MLTLDLPCLHERLKSRCSSRGIVLLPRYDRPCFKQTKGPEQKWFDGRGRRYIQQRYSHGISVTAKKDVKVTHETKGTASSRQHERDKKSFLRHLVAQPSGPSLLFANASIVRRIALDGRRAHHRCPRPSPKPLRLRRKLPLHSRKPPPLLIDHNPPPSRIHLSHINSACIFTSCSRLRQTLWTTSPYALRIRICHSCPARACNNEIGAINGDHHFLGVAPCTISGG
jgi:hypothetical protein